MHDPTASPEAADVSQELVMLRRGIFRVLAGGVAVLLSGCGLFGRNSYRFKMTVEIETPDGLKRGSSVYRVRAWRTSDLMTGGSGSDAELLGEAVAVDLPGNKTLFALLRTGNATNWEGDLPEVSMRALDPAFDYHRAESVARIASGDGILSSAELAPADYPLLVTFRDINDPASVEKVEPKALIVKKVIIEVTDEAVTTGILTRLSWLIASPERRLDNDFKPTTNPSFAQKLRFGDFIKGKVK